MKKVIHSETYFLKMFISVCDRAWRDTLPLDWLERDDHVALIEPGGKRANSL